MKTVLYIYAIASTLTCVILIDTLENLEGKNIKLQASQVMQINGEPIPIDKLQIISEDEPEDITGEQDGI